ncbi:sulfur carrier protein ThiS [Nocardioides sp.]|uniref:sulfur carrier protein ThiS n=1 Tax=Nocardioides sp. TaxID=35761 RepID=UPI00273230AD|nr:sulfur carrier protein ThiS [Nocardioides sp.]MDP3894711.1 sulfur carrier protein ThiS [Nocardioides sp.]
MDITVNGTPTAVPDNLTLTALLVRRGGHRDGTAVALNGTVVPRSELDARRLGAGDVVEIVTAVQGG